MRVFFGLRGVIISYQTVLCLQLVAACFFLGWMSAPEYLPSDLHFLPAETCLLRRPVRGAVDASHTIARAQTNPIIVCLGPIRNCFWFILTFVRT